MKSFATTTTAPASKPSTILSLFRKSKKSSPSPSAERRTPPSPTHSASSSSSSTETLDIQLSFDLHSTPFSTYIPSSSSSEAPPAYSVGAGKEEDLEVVEKSIQMDAKELKRQGKEMKLLEEGRRMSEQLKGLGF